MSTTLLYNSFAIFSVHRTRHIRQANLVDFCCFRPVQITVSIYKLCHTKCTLLIPTTSLHDSFAIISVHRTRYIRQANLVDFRFSSRPVQITVSIYKLCHTKCTLLIPKTLLHDSFVIFSVHRTRHIRQANLADRLRPVQITVSISKLCHANNAQCRSSIKSLHDSFVTSLCTARENRQQILRTIFAIYTVITNSLSVVVAASTLLNLPWDTLRRVTLR